MKSEREKKAVIFGAGITGLKVGFELSKSGYNVLILEKTGKNGGMAHSFKYKDCILDYGPHKFYSQIKGIMPEFKELIGDDCLTREKTNSLYLLNTYFRFPPKPIQLFLNISPVIMIKCAGSYMFTNIKNIFNKKESTTYEEYFINGFGKEGYNLLFRDLCEKVWGDPKKISAELARRRVPVPNVMEFIKNAITTSKERPEVSAKYFYYPRKGFQQLADALEREIIKNNGTIEQKIMIKNVEIEKKKVKRIQYRDTSGMEKEIINPDVVISTIPLQDLIICISPMPKKAVKKAVEGLKYRALILCYFILNKEKALKDNWYFYPEASVCFNRVSEQKSFSPETVPKNKTVITAEITCENNSYLFNADEDEIKEKVLTDLEKVHVLKREEVIDFLIRKSKRAYPVYDVGYLERLDKVLDVIENIDNLYSIGRQGLFNYNNTDHCMDMANRTANHIISKRSKGYWKELLKEFNKYRIVD